MRHKGSSAGESTLPRERESLEDLEPSHVVWAKMPGCPWWPAYQCEPATAAQRDTR